jgi:SAM-dependent methyltransferase
MQRFQDYDAFAWLYTHHWGDEFHRAVKTPLERALLSRLPKRSAILDLCCGDGRLAAALERRGFLITGIDGSEQMLAFARRRCKRARLLLADAREFHLEPQFDAVTCMFDSLNHVMKTAELRKVFANVWRCLLPGGAFIFDLNREEAYSQLWCQSSATVADDVVSVARGSYFPRQRLAVCDITLVRRHGKCWRRTDFQMRQRLHPREQVLAALESCGFSASAHDARELGMEGPVGFGRDFFLARKSAESAQATGATNSRREASRGSYSR